MILERQMLKSVDSTARVRRAECATASVTSAQADPEKVAAMPENYPAIESLRLELQGLK
ncbi:Uncharacterized protein DAT39_008138, partial [Clarias magur]